MPINDNSNIKQRDTVVNIPPTSDHIKESSVESGTAWGRAAKSLMNAVSLLFERTATFFKSLFSRKVKILPEEFVTPIKILPEEFVTPSDRVVPPHLQVLNQLKTDHISSKKMEELILNNQFSDDVHYKVKGSLEFDHVRSLDALPKYMTIEGRLSVQNCPKLKTMPEILTVQGPLSIENCQSLTTLSDTLVVGADLRVENCHSLTTLPKKLNAAYDLSFFGCERLEYLPDWMIRLGLTDSGHARTVNLEETNPPYEVVQKLYSYSLHPDSDVKFKLSDSALVQTAPSYHYLKKGLNKLR
ncbi:hypothetical protein [Endozoicomonas sp.]|uniref:hypothetical protein n=1 Tax=Endozoicomonas sp. TaxID=1892382 RepID=UPI003AF50674